MIMRLMLSPALKRRAKLMPALRAENSLSAFTTFCAKHSRPVDAVNQNVEHHYPSRSFERFTKTFCHAYRRAVFSLYQANDVWLVEFIKGVFKRLSSGFSRVAFPPKLSLERPANFKPGPAFRIYTTNTSSKAPASFFLNRPNTVTAEIPMPDHRSHMAPGLRAIEYFSAHVAHHFRISA